METVETVIDTQQQKEEVSEEESENSEYYDEQGKYIWGEEGADWEFYD